MHKDWVQVLTKTQISLTSKKECGFTDSKRTAMGFGSSDSG